MANVSLRIISPGYSGFEGAYIDSLLRTRKLCAEREIPFHWSCVEHRADIIAVRNFIGETFMKSGFTHLLMPDSDIGWDPNDLAKMIDYDKPFVAAAPPAKVLRLDTYAKAVKSDLDHPERFLAKFWVDPIAEDKAKGRFTVDEAGFCKVESVGSTFMLIKREVFETLAKRHPELHTKKGVGYFEHLIDDGDVFSEDLSFCRRWRKAGGDIHVYTNATMTQTGPYTFTGNLAEFLRTDTGALT
jgi:hypothetical protein